MQIGDLTLFGMTLATIAQIIADWDERPIVSRRESEP
jgi:hypothetical protein